MSKTADELWEEIVNDFDDFLYGPLGIEQSVFGNVSGDFYDIDTDAVVDILKKLKELEILQNGILDYQKEKLEFLKEDFLNLDNGNNQIEDVYYQLNDLYMKIDEM